MTENDYFDLWELGARLHDAAYRFEISARLVLIMHTAFTSGDTEPGKDDFEALYAVYLQQDEIAQELKEISSALQTARHRVTGENGGADVLRSLDREYKAGMEGRPPMHLPEITPADPEAREQLEIYRNAMAAMYARGLHMKAVQDADS